MHTQVLQKVVVAVEALIAGGVSALEWFFMSVDGPDMPFQVFATTEAFATIFHLAYIDPILLTVSIPLDSGGVFCGGHSASTTFLC